MGRKSKTPRPQVGEPFGLWTVRSLGEGLVAKSNYCVCECACGTVKPVRETNLTRGLSTNCGCDRARKTGDRFRKHGESRGGKSAEYIAWRGMTDRCTNRNNGRWDDYGGRGITVCERWTGANGYVNFLADMGRRPSHWHSLDRKENDGNYEPGNCRWATKVEQARNKRNSRMLEADGTTRCLAEWAALLRLDSRVIQALIRRGVTMASVVVLLAGVEPKNRVSKI